MKLRANCDDLTLFMNGMMGLPPDGALTIWEIDVQHQANGRSGDGPDIMAVRGGGVGMCLRGGLLFGQRS
jgi:hypothetical protein